MNREAHSARSQEIVHCLKFQGFSDGEGSATDPDHSAVSPVAENAADTLTRHADAPGDFLMCHVEGDAQAVGGCLRMLFRPLQKELGEFGMSVGSQAKHPGLLQSFVEFHAK